MFKRIRNTLKDLLEVYCREFSLVLHDAGIILFCTFLPLAYPVIYSLIYNPELVKDVPMVVVDHDRTRLSRELVREIDACDQARVSGYAADLNEARRAMAAKDCFAILEIPEGFQRKIGNNEVGNAVMYCDMTLLLRYRGFLVATTNVMMAMGGELLAEKIAAQAPVAESFMTGDLLPISNVNMGNIQGGFDTFIMPGVLILILQQCLVLAIGMAGGAKHDRPSVDGYSAFNSGRSVVVTLVGEALCYMTLMILPALYMIHYVPLMFSFPMAGNLLEEMLFIVPFMLASIGMGLTFQAFVTEREAVFVNWVVTSLIFLFLSGLIWPRYAMPPVWKAVSSVFPATWGVEGFVKMNTNGSSLAQVHTDYINLWIITGVWWVLAYISRRFFVRPAMLRTYRSIASLPNS